jgi:acetyl esterase/lipase
VNRRHFLGVCAASVAAAAPSNKTRIAYGKDPAQFADLYLPQGPKPYPTVLFIHGDFWRSRDTVASAVPTCEVLARAGAAVWSIEYRRVGDPGGDWQGIASDVIHAAEHLNGIGAQHSLDLTHVVAAGHSAGGHLALWLASQRVIDLRSVIGLAAISDLRRAWILQLNGGVVRELMGGTPEQIPQRYAAASPAELLPISVPQKLVHGTADSVVPFDMSKRFAKASTNATLLPIPGAGHFDLIDPRSAAWATVQKTILETF